MSAVAAIVVVLKFGSTARTMCTTGDVEFETGRYTAHAAQVECYLAKKSISFDCEYAHAVLLELCSDFSFDMCVCVCVSGSSIRNANHAHITSYMNMIKMKAFVA